MAPAIPGIADVLSAHFQFDALARPTGGRLPFRVYNKYLVELDKALNIMRKQRVSCSTIPLRKGEIVLEVEGTVEHGSVIQHLAFSSWPGRLILTSHSLYFMSGGAAPCAACQKFDLADDVKQVVGPYVAHPSRVPLFHTSLLYESPPNNERVIWEFSQCFSCERRDYWMVIIQEIIYTHAFIRRLSLGAAGEEEAIARSIMGIVRLKATREALRANPPQPNLLLCYSMAHVSACGDLAIKMLADKLQNRDSQGPGCETSKRALTYARSASFILSTSRALYTQGSNKSGGDTCLSVGDFFVDEIWCLKKLVERAYPIWVHADSSEIVVSGEKADSLSLNLAIMAAVMGSFRPILAGINAVLSWDDPVKTISIILIGTLIIMRDLVQYAITFFVLGMAAFIVFFKQAGEGPLSGQVDIFSCSSGNSNSAKETLQLQRLMNGVGELLETGNIILLKIRALVYSIYPQATDQVILALMVMAVVIAVLPGKAIILVLFWELSTRKLPLRQENVDWFYEWWYRVPVAPVSFKDRVRGKGCC